MIPRYSGALLAVKRDHKKDIYLKNLAGNTTFSKVHPGYSMDTPIVGREGSGLLCLIHQGEELGKLMGQSLQRAENRELGKIKIAVGPGAQNNKTYYIRW